MTCINELIITGIRSFDPNMKNSQSIRFHKPLTVILGKNGAGKTTIIESLLNACTGKFPPGSMGPERSSFVYDPKVAGAVDVKAQIKLIFTAQSGEEAQVIRLYEVKVSKTEKNKFETLDCSISFSKGANRIVGQTYRKADIDQVVPKLLGVSTAVLEHVIFCHQEDSNWPLGPPKDLKEYFDKIFAATRYVAALEALKLKAKELDNSCKESERELATLEIFRVDAAQIQADVESKKEDLRLNQMRKDEIDPKLKKLHAAAAALNSKQQITDDLWNHSQLLQGRIDEKTSVIKKANVPPVTQTLQELKNMQRDFDSHMKQLARDVETKEQKSRAAEGARQQREAETRECQTAVERLLSTEALHKGRIRDLLDAVKSSSTEFVVGEDAVDENALNRLVQTFRSARDMAQQRFTQADEKSASVKAELTEKGAEVTRAMDADAKEKELKEGLLRTYQQRLADKKKELAALAGSTTSADRLQQIKQKQGEIVALTERINAAEALRKMSHHHKQAELLNAQITEKNNAVAQLRTQIMEGRKEGRRMGEVPFITKQIEEKQSQLEKIVAEKALPYLESQEKVPKDRSVSSVSLAVEQLYAQKRSSVGQADEQVRATERELAGLSEKLSVAKANVSTTERDLQHRQAVCSSVFQSLPLESFPSTLQAAEDLHIKTCRHVSSIESMSKCYETFVQAAKADQLCLVCKRSLTDGALVDFISLNEERQKTTPQQLAQVKLDCAEAKKAVDRLRQIESAVHDVIRLSSLLSEQKKIVLTCSSDVDTKKELLGALISRKNELESKEKICLEVFQSMKQVIQLVGDVANAKAELQSIERAALTADKGRKPLDVLEQECETGMNDIQKLNSQLQELQRQQQGTVSTDENAMKTQLLQINVEVIALENLQRRAAELDSNILELETEMKSYRDRVQSIALRRVELQQKLDGLRQAVESASASSAATLANFKAKAAETGDTCRKLDVTVPQVLDYLRSRAKDKLAAAREALKSAEAGSKQEDEEIQKLKKDIAEKRHMLNDQDRKLREIEIHVEDLTRQDDLQKEKEKLADTERRLALAKSEIVQGVEQVLGPQQPGPISKTRDAIRSTISVLETDKARLDGAAGAVRTDVDVLTAKLNTQEYSNIALRYNAEFLRVQTTKLALTDIDKVYIALDRAVQSYHQEKIAQVNQIINELWRSTYHESDIDTIEIRSDAEVTSNKRSYNYRVVIRRGSIDFDMRSKCSAGQKVLASVIIRLALSEAFCCDCGILALDEPTTNLDEDNARGLAEALKLLISSRQNVKHFQLILITHDEKFVRALGAQSAKSYYFVQKDRQGAFSRIEERSFETLFN